MNDQLKAAVERVRRGILSAEEWQSSHVRTSVAALRLILAALAEREWRPIETLDLPYDKPFDGWNRTMMDREIECWRSIDLRIWSYDIYGERQDVTDQITHFMPTPPLPDGPEQSGERGE